MREASGKVSTRKSNCGPDARFGIRIISYRSDCLWGQKSHGWCKGSEPNPAKRRSTPKIRRAEFHFSSTGPALESDGCQAVWSRSCARIRSGRANVLYRIREEVGAGIFRRAIAPG